MFVARMYAIRLRILRNDKRRIQRIYDRAFLQRIYYFGSYRKKDTLHISELIKNFRISDYEERKKV